MHYQIDSLAYQNNLRWLPPEQKLLFVLSLIILGYFAPYYLQLLIILWLMVWTVFYAKIPFSIYLQLLTIPVTFWLTSLPAFLIEISFTSEGLSAQIGGKVPFVSLWLLFSFKGLELALNILSRSICFTSGLYFILLTIPFGEVIRVLQQWRCPSLICELLLLTYRFIFVLATTATELIIAQQSRLGYRNWQRGIKSFSMVIAQLLQRALENYREISLGLASRGFNGQLRVWCRRRYVTNWRYVYEAIGGYSFLLVLFCYHQWRYFL